MNKNNYSRPFLDKLELLILNGVSPQRVYQATLEYLDDYDDEVSKLKQQRDELLAVLKSRPKHCEYCDDGGEGDIDIDKFIVDVSAWAFKARSAIKNAEGE